MSKYQSHLLLSRGRLANILQTSTTLSPFISVGYKLSKNKKEEENGF